MFVGALGPLEKRLGVLFSPAFVWPVIRRIDENALHRSN